MSESELHRPPPIPLDQYAGKWIVWDRAKTRILASTRTFEEAVAAAKASGESEPMYEKVPKGERWHGAIG